MIEVFGGTILFDEADFARSQIGADIAKILNCGYQQSLAVTRMEKTPDGNFEPKVFDVFGPKIINGRKAFQDDATESRCIQYTPKITKRKDLPLQLGPQFNTEVKALQDKALMWRFDHLDHVEPEDSADLLRIPGHADQRSGVMVISVPGSCRSGFRDDGDHDSGLMPIKKAVRSRNDDRLPRNTRMMT
jgi:hypothetical protein